MISVAPVDVVASVDWTLVLTPLISGIFIVLSTLITVKVTRKNNEKQAGIQTRSVDIEETTASAQAFSVAEGIYRNSIERLSTENKILRDRISALESRDIEREKELGYLKDLIRNDKLL